MDKNCFKKIKSKHLVLTSFRSLNGIHVSANGMKESPNVKLTSDWMLNTDTLSRKNFGLVSAEMKTKKMKLYCV